jgi:plastocyanin
MVKAREKSRWPGWFLVLLLGFSDKLAAGVRVLELQIKDHLFSPATLYVPAGEKIKLVIDNQDGTPEEFESFSLNREKVILGHSKGVVFVGPLAPGEHAFVGEYHPDSARGQIVVVPLAQWLQLEQTDAD